MATSGRLQGNSIAISGRGGNYVFVNWQLAGQDIGRNVSAINWQMYVHFQGADAQLDNGYADVGPARRYANGGRVYNFSQNYSVRDMGIASGSFEIGHNAQGQANLYVASGISFYQSGRSEAGATWDLPTIPRDAYLTNLSQDITDADNPWVEFSNAGGFAVNTWFEMPYNAGTGRIHQRNNVGSRFTWNFTEAERAYIRSLIPNQNQVTIRYVIETDKGGGGFGYDYRDRLYTIVGDRNPTFTDFDYQDTNTDITAITGNPYVLIQGKSTLRMTIPANKKMVANKQSNPVNYVTTIDGTVDTQPYSATASVISNMGVVNGTGSKTLSVRANDSRGNSTTATKQIEVIPYAIPDIVYVANRQNNFENVTEIKLSGTYSPVPVDGVNKNSITANSLKYRKRQDGGTWSSWTTVPFSQTAQSFTAPMQYEDILNSSIWDFEVQVTDKFGTVTESFSVDRGVPIVMISDNLQGVGIGKMPEMNRKLDVGGDIYSNNKRVAIEQAVYVFCRIDGNSPGAGYAGLRRFNAITASGIDAVAIAPSTSITRFVVKQKGLYSIDFRQLIRYGNAINYYIAINGTNVDRAWQNNIQKDAIASWRGVLNVDDYVELTTDYAPDESWSDTHSHFSMIMNTRLS